MSPEEGPPKKVLRRRSSEEGPLKKVLRRRSSEECPLKKVLRIIRIRSSEEKVLRREGPPKRSPPEEGPSKKVLRRRSSEEARQLRRFFPIRLCLWVLTYCCKGIEYLVDKVPGDRGSLERVLEEKQTFEDGLADFFLLRKANI